MTHASPAPALSDDDRAEILGAVKKADLAAHLDSNDYEIEMLSDALDLALRALGLDRPSVTDAEIAEAQDRD